MDGEHFYRHVWVPGVDTGESFKWIKRIWRDGGEAWCRAVRPETLEPLRVPLHAGLIEAPFQLLNSCWTFDRDDLLKAGEVLVPFAITALAFTGKPCRSGEHLCHARITAGGRDDRCGGVRADLALYDEEGHAIMTVSGFETRRLQRQALVATPRRASTYFYTLAWRPTTLPAATRMSREARQWVLFLPVDIAVPLLARLRASGEEGVIVFPGEVFARLGDERFTINPQETSSYSQLFAQLPVLRKIEHQEIVFSCLWNASGAESEAQTCVRLASELVRLVQAAVKVVGPRRMWFVAHAAHSMDPTEGGVSPSHRAAWSLTTVLRNEHPELETNCIDVGASCSGDVVENLYDEFLRADGEPQIAYRQRTRYVARLAKATVEAARQKADVIDSMRAYLITGGFGALGRHVARWLAALGVRNFVLVGRSGSSSEEAQALVDDLRRIGAKVVIAIGDVANADDVKAVLSAMVANDMPVLKGIFHAAGILDDGALLHLSPERLERVLAPKVGGACQITLLAGQIPDAVITYFSSASSIFGVPGQGAYAAANGFLDGLSQSAALAGVRVLTVAWGPWAGAGMAASVRRDSSKGPSLLSPLMPDQALDSLKLLLSSHVRYSGVFDLDQRALVNADDRNRAFLSEVAEVPSVRLATAAGTLSPGRTGEQSILKRIVTAPPSHRARLLRDYVRFEVGQVLGETSQVIDTDRGFASMGLDSLASIELRSRLQQSFNIDLPVTFAFDHPNIELVVAELAVRLNIDPSQPASSDALFMRLGADAAAEASVGNVDLELAKLEQFLRPRTPEGR
jgi:NAD(P)-dependent dehydrogenase (short-subunit alcohol dehydrogenase family)/acyl carrier protein